MGTLTENRETYYRLYAKHPKGGGFQENTPGRRNNEAALHF
jgi:hypothetical protein